jgi:hypothetical protein
MQLPHILCADATCVALPLSEWIGVTDIRCPSLPVQVLALFLTGIVPAGYAIAYLLRLKTAQWLAEWRSWRARKQGGQPDTRAAAAEAAEGDSPTSPASARRSVESATGRDGQATVAQVETRM